MQIVHSIDKLGIWPRLPVILGLLYLGIRRHLHSEYNLFNVGKSAVGVRFNPVDYPYRTADGKYNDPFNGGAGSEGTFFGRNILPVDQKDKVVEKKQAKDNGFLISWDHMNINLI
jgi:alpha-dioxygenase